MMDRKILIFTIFQCIVSIAINAQPYIRGKIVAQDTYLPIAFASILYQKQDKQNGVISDIRGDFEIRESGVIHITVSCVGYKTTSLSVTSTLDLNHLVIALEKSIYTLDEVIVRPGENPALRIIRLALKNKKRNDFEHYDQYNYRCYTKTIFDFKLDDNANSKDSAFLERQEFLRKRAFFISESVLSSSRINNRTENKIIATRTSGFKEHLLGQGLIELFHHAISFYSNNISLFRQSADNRSMWDFFGPLSDNCLNAYDYDLEDSYTVDADTIHVINFHPLKGKNFNALKGKLYISTNGYAIKDIVTEPFESGFIDFRFRQSYEFVEGKWFPSQLDEEIVFVSLKMQDDLNIYPVYLVTAKIDGVKYQTEIKNKQSINLEKFYIDKLSVIKSDSLLQIVRPEPLSVREMETYHFMDSLGDKYDWDHFVKFIPKLAKGRIPVKFIDIGLFELYRYNKYEGSRIGLGLYTNEKISNYFSLGGYIGYGFRDDALKYGGQVIFDICEKHDIQLTLSYRDDLKEAGSDNISDYSLFTGNHYLRSFVSSRFDHSFEKRADFAFRVLRFMKITTSLSLRDMSPEYEYKFKGEALGNYSADNIQVNLKYAYNEELSTIDNQRFENFKGNPIINLNYKRGVDWFNTDSYQYNSYELIFQTVAYNGRMGQSNISLAAGYIDKDIPYSLLFTGEGSKNSEASFVIHNSFQTMLPYEFLSDKYVHLFYTHNFGSLLFKTANFKPQFIINQNVGWGTLRNPSYHEIDFKEKNKVFLESGLVVNSLYRTSLLDICYLGWGAGVFYRYGYYGLSKVKDNFAFKLAFTITFW